VGEIILVASASCTTEANCPAAYVLPSGDFALIGKEAAAELHDQLPAGPRVGAGERLVIVPRTILIDAVGNLPEVQG
jgi:hypothetical protein